MKKCILLVFVMISMYSYGQETTSTLDQKTSLEKVAEFVPSEFRINKNDEVIMGNPLLTEARAEEDTAAMELAMVEPSITINMKYVRMDPGKVESLFPETVTIDMEGNANIDYISFIPILLEALNEQQKIVEEMKARILILEQASDK